MTMVVKTLAELREQRISIPSIFSRGVGVKRTLGSETAPRIGPTELELIVWLPVAEVGEGPSWDEVNALLGEPGPPGSRLIAAEVIAALGIEAMLERGANGSVRGRPYPGGGGFGNVFWKHSFTLQTTGGLLVSLVKA